MRPAPHPCGVRLPHGIIRAGGGQRRLLAAGAQVQHAQVAELDARTVAQQTEMAFLIEESGMVLAVHGIGILPVSYTHLLRGLTGPMTDARIRLREEVAEQIKALKEIRTMGEYYGLDLSRPAHSAQEAVQWVYMAYLAAVKEQDGAAMSLGNVSSFLDIFIEYDLAHGNIDEVFRCV